MTDMFDNPALCLALDYTDDTIWSIVSMNGPVPFSAVTSIVNAGLGSPGRPVEETVRIWIVDHAWRAMLDRHASEPTKRDIRDYADLLGIDPSTIPNGPYDGMWSMLTALWPFDRTLAAIAVNHALIYRRIGIFAPHATMLPWVDEVIKRDDARWFVRRCVELPPGGLTAWEAEHGH